LELYAKSGVNLAEPLRERSAAEEDLPGRLVEDFASMTVDTYDAVDVILGRVTIGAGGAAAKVAVMALVSVILTGSILKRRDLVGE